MQSTGLVACVVRILLWLHNKHNKILKFWMTLFMHIECYFEYKTGVPESWHKVQHKIPNSFLCAQFSFTLQQ